MNQTLILLTLMSVTSPLHAQGLEELLLRLKSPAEAERSEALVGLGKLATPDAALLSVVADSLLDEAEVVRVSAAYSLAGIAGKLGCKLDTLAECKLFTGVLDATPKIAKRVPPIYPDEAKRNYEQGQVRVEFLVGADGLVYRLRIVDGPPALRDAAAESLKRSKYQPARKSGKPVPFAMVTTMAFRLK